MQKDLFIEEQRGDNNKPVDVSTIGIYFGDSGTAVTGVVEVGTASTTITIASGIKAPLPDGARFTATTESTDRTLCCPPTDTSPPFDAAEEGLNTTSTYPDFKLVGGNLIFDSLIIQDTNSNASDANPSDAVNRKINIKTPSGTFKILAFDPSP